MVLSQKVFLLGIFLALISVYGSSFGDFTYLIIVLFFPLALLLRIAASRLKEGGVYLRTHKITLGGFKYEVQQR